MVRKRAQVDIVRMTCGWGARHPAGGEAGEGAVVLSVFWGEGGGVGVPVA